jgi:hypothetical protein
MKILTTGNFLFLFRSTIEKSNRFIQTKFFFPSSNMHMPHHVKDILIGLLVAYVALDILLSMAGRHQGMFGALARASSDENVAIILVIGLGLGFLAYYLAKHSREMYSTKKAISA